MKNIKKVFIGICLSICWLGLSLAQYQQHQVTVRNVAVPLRVYLEGNFIEDLTREDIELYDNDQLQKIKALYLISKMK